MLSPVVYYTPNNQENTQKEISLWSWDKQSQFQTEDSITDRHFSIVVSVDSID